MQEEKIQSKQMLVISILRFAFYELSFVLIESLESNKLSFQQTARFGHNDLEVG